MSFYLYFKIDLQDIEEEKIEDELHNRRRAISHKTP